MSLEGTIHCLLQYAESQNGRGYPVSCVSETHNNINILIYIIDLQ